LSPLMIVTLIKIRNGSITQTACTRYEF